PIRRACSATPTNTAAPPELSEHDTAPPGRGGGGPPPPNRFLADIRVQRTLHLADGLLRQTTASG
ncbi:hypothetical protein, partial [Nocardia cyriacigeorgica]|uniref:hypothetical protein n=1 Tax=Nocardia cyriacigeorgica TaxID=135487 RepID=UPI0024590475